MAIRVPIGSVFERLTVIASLGVSKGFEHVVVRCECGTEKRIRSDNLRRGHAKSCGCMRRDRAHKLNETHRQAGPGRTPLYRAWEGMRQRVRTRESYAARGIDPVWDANFEPFRDYVLEHLGSHPKGGTIDRIKNELGYVPGNIRWASPTVQQRNRGDYNHVIVIDGVSRCIAEWSDAMGISQQVICRRLARGWSERDAVLTPLQR